MELQPRLGRQPTLPRHGIVAIDHGQRFEQVAARLGKAIVDVDELPPGMGQAMGQDRLQLARQVARQGIAHLDRRRQLLGAVLEDLGQVLARVPAAAEEQRHPVAVAQRDHARGVQAAALVGVARVARGTGQGLLPASFPHQLQDLDRGVIVVQHLALRRLPDQLRQTPERGSPRRPARCPTGSRPAAGLSRSPCRPSRRLNGSPLPYFNSPIMLPAVASYFVLARLFGRGRGEDLAAQMAAQLLQLVDRRRQRRLPGDPHQHARGLLVDGALTAGGTRVARGERRVRHVDPLGTPVSLGAVAPVTLGGRRRVRFVGVPVAGSRLGLGRGVTRRSGLGLPGLLPHHGFGLLRARPEEQLAEPANRRVLVFHQVGHVGVRLEDRANQRGVLLVERLLDAAQDLLQSRAVHFDELRRVSHPQQPAERTGITGRFPATGVASHPGSSGARPPRSRKSPSRPGQVSGPTGRQSAAAPVRVGLPAESRTAS